MLMGCIFSRTICHEILAWSRMTVQPSDGMLDFFEWWTTATNATPTCLRKGLCTLTILTAWAIWKHRNATLFNAATPSPTKLLDDIKLEATLWARADAKGLERTIPIT